ncbi:hypothetical protein GCM10022267_81050 [Lentzea roselyniae]|uniref:Uncharacterized protein n=1 Tax=Lentzea roselyniae TaxID=531940 RepID=A0ABP7CB41_9PSEU
METCPAGGDLLLGEHAGVEEGQNGQRSTKCTWKPGRAAWAKLADLGDQDHVPRRNVASVAYMCINGTRVPEAG